MRPTMSRIVLTIIFGSAAFNSHAATDVASAEKTTDSPVAVKPEPKPEQSVTPHTLKFGALSLDYNATAGTAIIRDDADKPIASMGYIAYTKRGVKDLTRRPILFAFNGGPGSSSLWLHMGYLGPKRVATPDAQAAGPAPFNVVDNIYSPLDKSDIVLIDPVGTGLSKAVGGKKVASSPIATSTPIADPRI